MKEIGCGEMPKGPTWAEMAGRNGSEYIYNDVGDQDIELVQLGEIGILSAEEGKPVVTMISGHLNRQSNQIKVTVETKEV